MEICLGRDSPAKGKGWDGKMIDFGYEQVFYLHVQVIARYFLSIVHKGHVQ